MKPTGDPWISGWAAAIGMLLIVVGLLVQLWIERTEPEPAQTELATELLQHAFDSVTLELDSVRAICPEPEVKP